MLRLERAPGQATARAAPARRRRTAPRSRTSRRARSCRGTAAPRCSTASGLARSSGYMPLKAQTAKFVATKKISEHDNIAAITGTAPGQRRTSMPANAGSGDRGADDERDPPVIARRAQHCSATWRRAVRSQPAPGFAASGRRTARWRRTARHPAHAAAGARPRRSRSEMPPAANPSKDRRGSWFGCISVKVLWCSHRFIARSGANLLPASGVHSRAQTARFSAHSEMIPAS